jgi:hypothetical protein
MQGFSDLPHASSGVGTSLVGSMWLTDRRAGLEDSYRDTQMHCGCQSIGCKSWSCLYVCCCVVIMVIIPAC